MQAISATSRSELVQPHHRRQPNLLTRFLLFVEALIVFMSLASPLVWSTTQFSSGNPFPVLSQLAFLWTTSVSSSQHRNHQSYLDDQDELAHLRLTYPPERSPQEAQLQWPPRCLQPATGVVGSSPRFPQGRSIRDSDR
ncbi:hypothetical protein EV363DRAFT_1236417 [Boletus edulis]|uniref:Uncharacterized protein n=1 Tax=Boletus edulis BED1 TaxID=1328754 RepID=A0AAD4G8I9_BOLED|nr:hypothetical protein EV363DRAFT_1236417 [Boletus edulis]KAF8425751.1 hypothetical protein L210DRAFT_3566680 [Boletus edulis BED1]